VEVSQCLPDSISCSTPVRLAGFRACCATTPLHGRGTRAGQASPAVCVAAPKRRIKQDLCIVLPVYGPNIVAARTAWGAASGGGCGSDPRRQRGWGMPQQTPAGTPQGHRVQASE
jgi:hypothetical protein